MISQPYTVICLSLLILTGCLHGKGKTNKGTEISSPVNAESPSTAKDSETKTVATLPPGTIIKASFIPATPDQAAQFLTTYDLLKGATLTQHASSSEVSVAPARAPDKSVEIFKAQAAERRWLLFVGIGLGVAGIALMSIMPEWKGLYRGAFGGTILALCAWKLAEIPAWAWGLTIGISVLLAIGYKRKEQESASTKADKAD